MSYKILSLDGGGSWALIQARVLLDIYGDIKGHDLLKQFDMAIANSGGSLVLACLCTNMKLSEVVAVFESSKERKKIFSPLNFWEKLKWKGVMSMFRNLTHIGAKYSTKRKMEGLIEVLRSYDHLGNTKAAVDTSLDELPAIIGKPDLQLIIVGYDYFRERVSFFRSNKFSNTDKFSHGKYYHITLGHAIHASSNAPVNYFDAPAEVDLNISDTKDCRKNWFWDGAVSGFNNPVLAGLVEAITNGNGRNLSEYCVLSLGTGISRKAIVPDLKTSKDPQCLKIYELNKNNELAVTEPSFKVFSDISKMAQSILSDPPDSATFIAYSFLDPSLKNKANIVRINPCLSPVKGSNGVYELPPAYKIDQDGRRKFIALLEMDMDAVEDEQVNLITDLCNKFISGIGPEASLPNQYIRGDGTGEYLGQGNYQDAKQRWMQIIKPSELIPTSRIVNGVEVNMH